MHSWGDVCRPPVNDERDRKPLARNGRRSELRLSSRATRAVWLEPSWPMYVTIAFLFRDFPGMKSTRLPPTSKFRLALSTWCLGFLCAFVRALGVTQYMHILDYGGGVMLSMQVKKRLVCRRRPGLKRFHLGWGDMCYNCACSSASRPDPCY